MPRNEQKYKENSERLVDGDREHDHRQPRLFLLGVSDRDTRATFELSVCGRLF
jgi:hypothetical protein